MVADRSAGRNRCGSIVVVLGAQGIAGYPPAPLMDPYLTAELTCLRAGIRADIRREGT